MCWFVIVVNLYACRIKIFNSVSSLRLRSMCSASRPLKVPRASLN